MNFHAKVYLREAILNSIKRCEEHVKGIDALKDLKPPAQDYFSGLQKELLESIQQLREFYKTFDKE